MRSLLIAAFCGFVLLSLSVLGAVVFSLARETLLDQAVHHLEAVATARANAVETVKHAWIDRLKQIAGRTQLRMSLRNWQETAAEEERAKVQHIIDDTEASDSSLTWIGIAGPDGTLISATSAQPAGVTSHLDAAHEAGQAGPGLLDVRIVEPFGVQALMAAPIILDHGLVGVAIVILDPAELFAVTADYTGLGKTGETLLVQMTPTGDALFMNPIRFDPDSTFKRVVGSDRDDVAVTHALRGTERAFVDELIDYKNADVVAVTHYLSETGWGLVAQIDRSEALEPITRLRDRLLLGCVVILALGAALAAFLSRRLTQSLADKELQIDAIIDTAVDAIITIDERGHITRFNASAEAMFDYTEEEVHGKNVRMLMPEDHAREHDRYLDRYKRTGQARVIGTGQVELMGRKRSGDFFPMELGVSEGRVGEVRFFAGSIRDISERKKARAQREELIDQLRGSNLELERSNRELDDFAYIASHDLKEPLRAIQNHATFLLEDYQGKLDADGEKRLNRLTDLGRRMEKLIADLLYFARLGRGQETMEPVDLNAIIADIKINLADTLQARNGRIAIATPLSMVAGNPAHFTALFKNLINNATKYNDADEKLVEIGIAAPDEHGKPIDADVFYVRDNGIGIEEQFQDDIFRIFKRLNSEKAYGEGTGAGLSFVKKIIENHGGELWLKSAPGEGSTFFFTLPPADASADAAVSDRAA